MNAFDEASIKFKTRAVKFHQAIVVRDNGLLYKKNINYKDITRSWNSVQFFNPLVTFSSANESCILL